MQNGLRQGARRRRRRRCRPPRVRHSVLSLSSSLSFFERSRSRRVTAEDDAKQSFLVTTITEPGRSEQGTGDAQQITICCFRPARSPLDRARDFGFSGAQIRLISRENTNRMEEILVARDPRCFSRDNTTREISRICYSVPLRRM